MKDLSEVQKKIKFDIEATKDKNKREDLKRERNKIINTLHNEIDKEERKTSRMLGSIVLHLCRSSLGGSIIFICPDHFVGLFVL